MIRILQLSLLAIVLLSPIHATAQPAELMLAARSGDLELVKELLVSGAEPDPKGIATPLYFAAQGGHLEIAELLLESGADPNAQSDWGTPLHIAARRGHIGAVSILLQQGANSNSKGGELDNTPLHEAAYVGATEIGRLLIDWGANVNARNKEFEPPVHLAVQRGKSEIAELLREAGARPIDFEPISEELAGADVEEGRIRALECEVCHQLTKDKPSIERGPQTAPLLWDVVGRPIASTDSMRVSDAMRAETGNWTYERLNTFIGDPAGSVPGSGKYRGFVRDRTARINIIAYLRTLSESPVPLP
jgi:cytochrome c